MYEAASTTTHTADFIAASKYLSIPFIMVILKCCCLAYLSLRKKKKKRKIDAAAFALVCCMYILSWHIVREGSGK